MYRTHARVLRPAGASRSLAQRGDTLRHPAADRVRVSPWYQASRSLAQRVSSVAADHEIQRLLSKAEVVATRHDRGWNFLLTQPAETDHPIDLAALRCAVPEAGAAVLFGAQVLAPPSLGLSVAAACAPLVAHALNHLAEVRQWDVVGLAALPGLYVIACG